MGTSTSGAHGLLWDDLQIAAVSLKAPASSAPTWAKYTDDGAGSTGCFAWEFSASQLNYLDIGAQLRHTYHEGSDVRLHLHWHPTTAGAGNIVFGAELEWTNATGIIGNSALYSITVAAPGIAKQQGADTVAVLSGTGKTISSLIGGRIWRDGAAVGDTYAGTVFIRSQDFHFQQSASGSRQEYSR